jgi:hypothetical protein
MEPLTIYNEEVTGPEHAIAASTHRSRMPQPAICTSTSALVCHGCY